MAKLYRLTTIHNNATEQFELNPKKPLKLKARANTRYELTDETGTVLHDVRMETVGDDVYIYAPNGNEVVVVLENFNKALDYQILKQSLNQTPQMALQFINIFIPTPFTFF